MEHKPASDGESPGRSSDRTFGLVFAGFFGIVATYSMVFGDAISPWAVVLSGLFLASAVLRPSMLAPLNRVWTGFGLLLHRIVSPVTLAAMFFLVITPTGLVMRIFRKDLLRLKLDKNAQTYWIERAPPGPAPETLKDQF